MYNMYIAVTIAPNGEPSPVWKDEDCQHMMTWKTEEQALLDTMAMPIAVQREILIIDLDQHVYKVENFYSGDGTPRRVSP